MHLKKWIVCSFYLCLFVSLGYLTYQDIRSNDFFWIVWGIATLSIGIQIINIVRDKKSWNMSYIVADKLILEKIKLSLSISYVYIVLFLVIVGIGLNQDWFHMNAIDVAFMAALSSLFVFMVSQIVQQLVK